MGTGSSATAITSANEDAKIAKRCKQEQGNNIKPRKCKQNTGVR